MQTIKWYTHAAYNDGLSISEGIEDEIQGLDPQVKKVLGEQLRNRFYEVGYEVEFDEGTGNIHKVTEIKNER